MAALSERFTNVVFLKVDIEKLPETALGARIQSIPQIHFLRSGHKVADPVVGAGDMEKVERTIMELKDGDEGGEDLPAGQMNLAEFFDKQQLECLNQSSEHTK